MTPAAALTQAAMDVTPAYADPVAGDGTTSGTAATLNADADSTVIPTSDTPAGADTTKLGWKNVNIALPATPDYTYNNSSQKPGKTGVTITAEYVYYINSSDPAPTTKYFIVDDALISEEYTSNEPDATEDPVDPKLAGKYKVTYEVQDTAVAARDTPDPALTAAVGAINTAIEGDNVLPYEIKKASATVTLPDGVVGVDTPGELGTKATVTTRVAGVSQSDLATSITYSNANKSEVSLTGADPAGKYVTGGVVPVTIVAPNAQVQNFNYVCNGEVLEGKDGAADDTTEFVAEAEIKNAGTYDVAIGTVAGTYAAVDNGKALEAKYTGNSMKNTVEAAITVKANGEEVADDFVYLDANGRAMVDGQGDPEYPTMPGKYQVQVKVGDKVVQTVPLTVYVDLNTMVVLKNDAAGSKAMNLTIDGRAADDVKLAFKDNIAFADVKSQIEDGAVATLNVFGEDPAPVDFAETFEVTKGTLAQTAGAAGTAYIEPISEDGVYRGKLEVKYTYGTLLPEVSLKRASEPYSGPANVGSGNNGYTVNDLVAVAKGPNNANLSPATPNPDYTVTATRTVDGKPVVKKGTEKITEVGTYTVVVEGAGSYVGKSEEMTFTITPLTLKFGANGNATVTYSDLDPTVGGGFSATYTGGQIKPTPTVTVTSFADGNETLTLQNPSNKKAAYDYTVSYGDNTTVAEGGTVDLSFTGNYAYDGAYSRAFAIAPASLADVDAEATAASQLKSEFHNTVEGLTVKLEDGTVLEEGVDYTVSAPAKASSQADAPAGCTKYEFTVTGKGNYSDSATSVIKSSFLVTDKSIEGVFDATVAEGSLYSPYAPAKPKVTVYQKGTKTEVTEGFSVSYENNENATTEDAPAYAVVTGTGQYAGQVKVPFQIAPLELSDASNVKGSVKLDGAEGLVYNGKEQVPQVLVKGSSITPVNEDYEGDAIPLSQAIDQLGIESEGGVDAGTSYMVIAPKTGNFKGSVKVPYEIAKADVAKATIEPAAVVPGADLADAVKVTYEGMELVPGTDYTVAAEGELPGTVAATISGAGTNFTGEVKKDVEVLYDVAEVTFEVANTTYNGKAQTPVVTAAYYMDGDKKVPVDAAAYDVKAGSYTGAGTYPIAIAGDEGAGWTGEKTVDFTIKPVTVTAKPQVSYDAAGLPVVTVPGLSSNDFTYKADPATKTITVTYKGNYAGTATVAYAPAAAPVAPEQPAAGKTGWVGSGNDWAYYENGQAVKGGWKLIGGEWYHFEANGKMTNTKWFQDADGEWYLLNQSHKGSYGAMLTGWQKVDGGWYYMGKSGDMQSGWAKVNGEWYLLNT
ncbi:hypothetical protein GMI69_09350, partial [Eggerthellaceae bacterium zg-887]|nr:hypothetical protein [Xiamenia xianingshaonis]